MKPVSDLTNPLTSTSNNKQPTETQRKEGKMEACPTEGLFPACPALICRVGCNSQLLESTTYRKYCYNPPLGEKLLNVCHLFKLSLENGEKAEEMAERKKST